MAVRIVCTLELLCLILRSYPVSLAAAFFLLGAMLHLLRLALGFGSFYLRCHRFRSSLAILALLEWLPLSLSLLRSLPQLDAPAFQKRGVVFVEPWVSNVAIMNVAIMSDHGNSPSHEIGYQEWSQQLIIDLNPTVCSRNHSTH